VTVETVTMRRSLALLLTLGSIGYGLAQSALAPQETAQLTGCVERSQTLRASELAQAFTPQRVNVRFETRADR
jgi:hypothetical protein